MQLVCDARVAVLQEFQQLAVERPLEQLAAPVLTAVEQEPAVVQKSELAVVQKLELAADPVLAALQVWQRGNSDA